MSIENTSQLFPEGRYKFTVDNVPEKKDRNGIYFWEFQLATELDGAPATYTEFLPIWLCAPIFKVLGYPEVRPGSFDVEPTKALGKQFEGVVAHEEIKSGNKQGQKVSRLKELVATIPATIPMAGDIPF